VKSFDNRIVPLLTSRDKPPTKIVLLRGMFYRFFKVNKYSIVITLTDMQKSNTDCRFINIEIVEAIPNEAIQALFVSTQQNNLELYTKYAVKWSVYNTQSSRYRQADRSFSYVNTWLDQVNLEKEFWQEGKTTINLEALHYNKMSVLIMLI
jgi:hypothetical protein